jgi:hypothetical protein
MGKNGNIHPTRIFETPDELYQCFLKYVQFVKDDAVNWPKVQYVGKDGTRKEDSPVLPLLRTGFTSWAFKNGYGTIHQYLENKDGLYGDFVETSAQILDEIRTQQVTGGLIKHFDQSLTARLNGLVEKTEVVQKGKVRVSWKKELKNE